MKQICKLVKRVAGFVFIPIRLLAEYECFRRQAEGIVESLLANANSA